MMLVIEAFERSWVISVRNPKSVRVVEERSRKSK